MVSTLGEGAILKELIFNSFYCGQILFSQFLLWEGVVVMKELIFNNFYFGRTPF